MPELELLLVPACALPPWPTLLCVSHGPLLLLSAARHLCQMTTHRPPRAAPPPAAPSEQAGGYVTLPQQDWLPDLERRARAKWYCLVEKFRNCFECLQCVAPGCVSSWHCPSCLPCTPFRRCGFTKRGWVTRVKLNLCVKLNSAVQSAEAAQEKQNDRSSTTEESLAGRPMAAGQGCGRQPAIHSAHAQLAQGLAAGGTLVTTPSCCAPLPLPHPAPAPSRTGGTPHWCTRN